MKDAYDILKYPVQTEKAVRMMQNENRIVFVVDKKAKTEEIKKAFEELFKVKPIKINTMVDTKNRKKAYIQLSSENPAIDIATQLGMM